MSCSDAFYGPDETPGTADDGYGEKDGPYQSQGHPAVTNYKIFKYKIDDKKDKCELDKECGGSREPCTGSDCDPGTEGGCVDPDDPNAYPGVNDDYYSYYFEFSDGSTVSGTSEDNIVEVTV